MGFMNIGSVFKSIGSGIKSIGSAALKSIAPAATNLLKGIVGSGFDAFKGVATKLVGSLPGPLGALATKYLAPLLGKGIDALKGMSQGAIENLVKKLVGSTTPREVPGAPAGSPKVTLPAQGTAERASGAAAATAEVAKAAGASGEGKFFGTGGFGSGALNIPSEPQMQDFGDLSKPENLFKAQTAMQRYSQTMSMLTSLAQMKHDTAKGVIQNFRA